MQIPLEPQKLEMLGRLTGSLVHDLNNLLTVIRLNAAVIEEGAIEPGEAGSLAGEITRACESATLVTRSVLSFLRNSHDPMTPFETGQALRDCLQILNALISRKTHLTVEIPERAFWVRGNPSSLNQAVMNLLLNAVDAAPKNGLRLTVRPRQDGPQEYVEILVADDGCGIDPRHLAQIFDPFFTTKKDEGTGLGLYIVRTVAHELEGWVEVSSVPGEGTTFRLTLPCCAPPSGETPAGTGQKPPAISLGQTVLLIEDDPGIRQIGRKILESAGCRVWEAPDVPSARAIWREQQGAITLVMADIILPGTVSGCELAQEFLREKPGLPVIYTSGNEEAVRGNPGLTEANFLPKPYRPDALKNLIARVCAT
jgi:two-component system cell cycle sensor histidine kinase/response regulator CckA